MSTIPDVAHIRAKARRDWETGQRARTPLSVRIGNTVPWWLVIIAAIVFALSIPHTINTFNIITPGVGYLAPLFVEFGLLYTSFRRRQLKFGVPKQVIIFELLLFGVAIIVNGVGTLVAVGDNANLDQQSMKEIIKSFDTMKATQQVALILVPIAALIIPIGTVVAGEGLATLLLESKATEDRLDTLWATCAAEWEYYALRDAAIAHGLSPRGAARWAGQIAGFGVPDEGRVSSPVSVSETPGETTRNAVRPVSNGNERERVKQFMEQTPGAHDMSLREIASQTDVSYSTVRRVLQDVSSGNGHHSS